MDKDTEVFIKGCQMAKLCLFLIFTDDTSLKDDDN